MGLFRRGIVYRGIYLPSLSGKLQDERLEFAYLRYAHRQRQKSLMLVNSADILLKFFVIWLGICNDAEEDKSCLEQGFFKEETRLAWFAVPILLNIILGTK